MKKQGHSFFPYTVYKDAIVALVIFLIILGMAVFIGVPLEAEADPLDTSYVPRPEWYFLFFFELLKHFPGSLEFLGALGVPALVIGILLLLPFLDRNPWRHPKARPLAISLMVLSLVVLVVLSIKGGMSPPPSTAAVPVDPSIRLTPLEREGKRIYQEQRCFVCHQINGEGGGIGPDLSEVGRRLTAAWVVGHLEDPEKLVPGTRMPEYKFSHEDMMGLTAYLLSLREKKPLAPGSPVVGTLTPTAEEGKAVFERQCAACHPNGSSGIGPKLFGATFEKRYPGDAELSKVIRQGIGTMPGYKSDQLSDDQLAKMIEYLRSIKEAK